MNRALMTAVVVAVGLAACAEMPRSRTTPDPARPQVTVVGGKYIVVDQEPIVVPKGQRDFRILWQLPGGSSYRFPRDGIVISDAKDQFRCGLEQDGIAYACVYRNATPGRYKYTIKVADAGRILELDPTIVSDF